jgi:hypothetical protein
MRSIGIYATLSFILVCIIAGGLFLSKQRQAHYLAVSSGASVSTPAPKVQKPTEPATAKAPESNNAASDASSTNQTTSLLPSVSTADVGGSNPATPLSQNSQTVVSTGLSGRQVPLVVPVTGPSMTEILLTDALMALAAYLVAYIVCTKISLKNSGA